MQGFAEIESLNIEGSMLPSLGLIYGIKKYDGANLQATDAIEFNHYPIQFNNNPFDYYIYYNENLLFSKNKNDSKIFTIPIKRAGGIYDINILPYMEGINPAYLFYSLNCGDRILLEIEQATESDFYSYLIYYSSNGNDYNLINELIGVENCFFASDSLSNGTHFFKIKTKDITGNISDYSSPISIKINKNIIPESFDSVNFSYSKTSQRMTIRGNLKEGGSNIDGMCIYGNYYPQIIGGLNALINSKNARHKIISYRDQNYFEYISQPLYPGVWIFGVTSISKYGIENEIIQKSYFLQWVNNNLEAIELINPIKPYSIMAEAIAGGQIKITLNYIYQEGIYLKIYENDILIEETSKKSNGTYSFIAGGIDGEIYNYYALATNGYFDSEPTNRVFAKADASAPQIREIINYKIII